MADEFLGGVEGIKNALRQDSALKSKVDRWLTGASPGWRAMFARARIVIDADVFAGSVCAYRGVMLRAAQESTCLSELLPAETAAALAALRADDPEIATDAAGGITMLALQIVVMCAIFSDAGSQQSGD